MTAPSIGSYTDFSQFAALRSAADHNDPAAIRAVASQFEAMFMQMMLKNMRDSSLAEPVFGQSDQHEMYQDMMDKQLSLEMASGKGIGLADMLVRQLGGEIAVKPHNQSSFNLPAPLRPVVAGPHSLRPATDVASVNKALAGSQTNSKISPGEFLSEIWPYAKRAAEKLNVSPLGLMAQAALETGWGTRIMQQSDGSSSFNIFGIKAGRSWTGESVTRTTLEFDRGVAKPQVARFRAYRNMAATFRDYSELISDNPRYTSVRNQGEDAEGFAKALQSAGYATDPTYADKITGVLRGETMKKAMLSLKTGESLPIAAKLGMEPI